MVIPESSQLVIQLTALGGSAKTLSVCIDTWRLSFRGLFWARTELLEELSMAAVSANPFCS